MMKSEGAKSWNYGYFNFGYPQCQGLVTSDKPILSMCRVLKYLVMIVPYLVMIVPYLVMIVPYLVIIIPYLVMIIPYWCDVVYHSNTTEYNDLMQTDRQKNYWIINWLKDTQLQFDIIQYF